MRTEVSQEELATNKAEGLMKNRVDCMNRVHKFANEVVPKLLDTLKHGFRLTNSFQLFSRDKDRLDDIIRIAGDWDILSQGSNGSRGSSARLKSDEYNIVLEVSDNYPVKFHLDGSRGYTCEYYKAVVYLWDNKKSAGCDSPDCGGWIDFKPREIIDYEQMITAKARLKEIHKEISVLKDELYPLQRLTGSQS